MTPCKEHKNNQVSSVPAGCRQPRLAAWGVLVNRGGLPTDFAGRVGGICCFTRGVYQHILARMKTYYLPGDSTWG